MYSQTSQGAFQYIAHKEWPSVHNRDAFDALSLLKEATATQIAQLIGLSTRQVVRQLMFPLEMGWVTLNGTRYSMLRDPLAPREAGL
jgi:hypothetical protein